MRNEEEERNCESKRNKKSEEVRNKEREREREAGASTRKKGAKGLRKTQVREKERERERERCYLSKCLRERFLRKCRACSGRPIVDFDVTVASSPKIDFRLLRRSLTFTFDDF